MTPTTAPIRRSAPGPRRSLPLLLLVAAVCLGVAPARAQLGFTEFALSDTSLNSSASTDFWIASAAPADVDADGDLDLVVAGYFVVYATVDFPGSAEERLTLYRNDGATGSVWTLTPIPLDATGIWFGATDVAWGDYDNDGDPDLVVGTGGQSVLYRNDAGSLVRTTTVLPGYDEDSGYTDMDQRSLSWADFDNDGDLDLLMPSAVVSGFDYLPTAILRNDGPGTAGAWTFTNIGAPLPVTVNGVSAWADMEGDGDLDLLLGNITPWGDSFLNTYRNDAGTMVPAESGLAFIQYGTADWGDADGDGDLDLLYGGSIVLPDETGETVVRVLRNDGAAGYTPVDVAHDWGGPAEAWLDFLATTWADYDSDGDVDILVSGEWLDPGEIVGRAAVYANNGGTFTLVSNQLPAPVTGQAGGAFTWFDVDGDGDLDYFVAGGYFVPNGNGLIEARTQLFRNDATAANAAPAAVAGLQSNVSGTDVTLAWNAATDDRTPQAALTYELEVKPTTAGPADRAPGAVTATGRALPQPGSASVNTAWTLRDLAPGTYDWSVRALDNAFNGGPVSQGTFVVGSVTDVGDLARAGFELTAPRPSPFRHETRLTLRLSRSEHMTVALYDVQGHRVALLHDGALGPGPHTLELRAANLASGLYFIQARGDERTAVRRVTLLR